MLEHNLLDEPVLGIAFDGTGFGTDNTIWGGEFILADGVSSMRRVAHLRPFRLSGGDAAIREPWRVAISILADAIGGQALLRRELFGVNQSQVIDLMRVLERPRLNVVTTSAGRLFDAAAAIILGVTHAQFDGAPAMQLEAACDTTAVGTYPFPLVGGEVSQLDWRPLFAALWADKVNGTEPPNLAMRFHHSVAQGIAATIRAFPGLPVVLGGGVFQNSLLIGLLMEELDGNRRLCLPGRIPPNDGVGVVL
jgi:hydrogenase maturation protein HypF